MRKRIPVPDRSRRDDAGFTLVELLVVVIIIGILAAIAIPIYMHQRNRGYDAQVVSQVRNIVTSVELTLHDDGYGALSGSNATGTVVAGTGVPAPVAPTDGVEWAVSGGARGYCVEGWATENSRYDSTSPLVYDSTVGEILPAGVPCLPISAPPPGGGGGGGGGEIEPGADSTLVFTYDLGAPGCDDSQVWLPFHGATIDWGDGAVDEGYEAGDPHYYADATAYTVTVTTGPLAALPLGWSEDILCLRSLDSWTGDNGPVRLNDAFAGAENLVYVATPPGQITSMLNAFVGVGAGWNQDLSDWDVSAVTALDGAFSGVTGSPNISAWDTSSVTSLSMTFMGGNFSPDISAWDTSSVTNMSYLAQWNSGFNSDISGWDVSSVTDMTVAFNGASAFNQDISGWDVSSATLMDWMFADATSFNQDLSGWDTSSIWAADGFADNTPAWSLPKPYFP